jgi:5-methylcytosine-specific restriction endonuclease McrA
MLSYNLSDLTDDVLLRNLVTLLSQDRATTATLLAHIAEVDSRKLYVPAGYPSMHAYCVEELHLSDDAAYKRITAARAARRYPALFEAVAEGRLHLTAICQLAPHLKPENVQELIEVATHRRKSEIEEMLARRFGVRDLPARTSMIRALGPAAPVAPPPRAAELALEGSLVEELVPGRVGDSGTASERVEPCQSGTVPGDELVPGRVGVQVEQPPPERFLLRLTIEKGTLERLRYFQALLSHAIPSGDLEKVLDQALQLAIPQLEKRKFGAVRKAEQGQVKERGAARKTAGARRSRKPLRKRHIPAHVRRAVWERDQRRCTFVSASGKRCDERRFLQFDHIDPFVRGGESTIDGLRLRCSAHNQYGAERVFGAEFMARKRKDRMVSG